MSGLVNFYRRHLPNLAAIARPLTALTRKDKTTGTTVPFGWNEQCEYAFQEVKRMLVSTPLLHLPDLSKPLYLWTERIWCILRTGKSKCAQISASRQTNPAEAKYRARGSCTGVWCGAF